MIVHRGFTSLSDPRDLAKPTLAIFSSLRSNQTELRQPAVKITSRFLLGISRARIGRHLLNADLCVHIAANPDTGQIRILKTTSSNRTFGCHLKCGFVRLHWFYRTERSDFTETSVQCERGLC